MTLIVFPTYVTSPDGTIHGYIVDTVKTWCGEECGTWSVLVGGEPTCEKCRHIGSLHRAEPAPVFANDSHSTCIHCHKGIHVVPGGSGATWVHSDTGAVVGSIDWSSDGKVQP